MAALKTARPADRAAERRLHRRVLISAPVGIAITRWPMRWFTRKPQFYGTLRDASIGGMLCLAGRPMPEHAQVKLWLDVELDQRQRQLTLFGEVAWVQAGPSVKDTLIGIRLSPGRSRTTDDWVRVMIDELRMQDGSRPM